MDEPRKRLKGVFFPIEPGESRCGFIDTDTEETCTEKAVFVVYVENDRDPGTEFKFFMCEEHSDMSKRNWLDEKWIH